MYINFGCDWEIVFNIGKQRQYINHEIFQTRASIYTVCMTTPEL